MASRIFPGIVLVLLTAPAMPVAALPIFEAFDTDTPDATDGSYPEFTLNVGTASVSGGVLQLGGGKFLQRFTRDGFSGDLIISGQIQAESLGHWNVGMEYGDRRFIFHPGFAGGAFRIEDAAVGIEVQVVFALEFEHRVEVATYVPQLKFACGITGIRATLEPRLWPAARQRLQMERVLRMIGWRGPGSESVLQ